MLYMRLTEGAYQESLDGRRFFYQYNARLSSGHFRIIQRLPNALGPLRPKIKLDSIAIRQTINPRPILQPILGYTIHLFTPSFLIFFFLV